MTQSPITTAGARRGTAGTSTESDAALALTALAWILTDGERAERFLGLTGLSPADLRAALGETATQAAILGFLTSHENDLVSCALAIDSEPGALAAAAARLDALAAQGPI